MFVRELLNDAQKRLITIQTESLLTDAARALSNPHMELVIVCDAHGKAVGVVTKADVVRRISYCEGAACRATVGAAMTREIVLCRPDDSLNDVWIKMKQHGLRHIPIVDAQSHPVGILNARDALNALLTNAAHETELLRDYVTTVGYR